MNKYRRIPLVFFSILMAGWLTVRLSLHEHLGLAGVLLPGLVFGLPFSLANFESRGEKIRGVMLNTLFATVSMAGALLLLFAWGPEGTGLAGMKFGLLLGFSCAAPLTVMVFAAYGLSWPSVLLAVVLGSILPALGGFEEAGEAFARPELFACFWLAVMGAVYSWGLKMEPINKV